MYSIQKGGQVSQIQFPWFLIKRQKLCCEYLFKLSIHKASYIQKVKQTNYQKIKQIIPVEMSNLLLSSLG